MLFRVDQLLRRLAASMTAYRSTNSMTRHEKGGLEGLHGMGDLIRHGRRKAVKRMAPSENYPQTMDITGKRLCMTRTVYFGQ